MQDAATWQTQSSADSSACDIFCQAAIAVGARVCVTRRDGLLDQLRRIASEDRSVSMSPSARAFLGDRASDIHDTISPRTAVGIAMWGIARTGTVAVAEPSHEDRLAHMLAARHVVIVPAWRIIPDLSDSGPRLRECLRDGTPYVTYITGPSRTSDIEKVLTIGVHGPGILDLLVVTDGEHDAH